MNISTIYDRIISYHSFLWFRFIPKWSFLWLCQGKWGWNDDWKPSDTGTGQDFHRISISLWGQRWTYITQMTHLGFRSRSPEGPDFAALNCSKPQPGWIRRRLGWGDNCPYCHLCRKGVLWKSLKVKFFGIWDITVYIHVYVYIYIYTHNFMLLLVLLFLKNRCWFCFRKVRNHKPF